MKIAWFTPFSKKSAIGKYSQIITNELKNYCDVDLWVPQCDDLLETDLTVNIIYLQNNIFSELSNYDLCIYNLGDHIYNHLEIYEISKKIHGMVILHDFIMHHFFTGYYFVHKKEPKTYINEMCRLYGEVGKKIAEDSLSGACVPIWDIDEIICFPFFEKVIEGALGIITHSEYLTEKVTAYTADPVKTLYFPNCFISENISNTSDIVGEIGLNDKRLLLLTVGHVNVNKRIDKIIRVLGENRKLAETVRYVVIGPYEENPYFKEMTELINNLNLTETVSFLGYQPDHILHAFMQQADVMINLRFPAMEGASWSLLEQLSLGKPVVVTDTGFYGELLCEGLIKINPSNETNDLAESLENICTDKKLREQKGMKSKEFYRDNFNTEKYCIEFMKLSINVLSRKPIVNLIDKVAEDLFQMGVNAELAANRTIAREIYKIFSANYDAIKPLEVGNLICFGNTHFAQDFLEVGWSVIEPWGVWSDAEIATLTFRIKASDEHINHSLNVIIKPWIANGRPKQLVTAFINQTMSSQYELTAPIEIKLPVCPDVHGVVTIDFKLKDPISPCELGISTDPRKLGICLISMELV